MNQKELFKSYKNTLHLTLEGDIDGINLHK